MLAVFALLFSLSLVVNFAESQVATITIKPDGSIDPPNTAIQQEGSIYFLTADLNCSIYIQKCDIILDGANHTLQGPGSKQNFIAITLMANNVTVTNFYLSSWKAGVYGAFSNNTITNNVFVDNEQGITVYACNFVVSQNSISGSSTAILVDSGVLQPQGDKNVITQNQLINNSVAFDILNSNGTIITKNNVAINNVILVLGTQNVLVDQVGFHMLYLNNFINNTRVLRIPFGGPTLMGYVTISPAANWDNGTLGNYWSDYQEKYPNASEVDNIGISDTPYLIEDVIPWSRNFMNGTYQEGITVLGTATDHYPLTAAYNCSSGAAPQPYHSPSKTSTPIQTTPPTSISSKLPSQSSTESSISSNYTSTITYSSSIPEFSLLAVLSLTLTATLLLAIFVKKRFKGSKSVSFSKI